MGYKVIFFLVSENIHQKIINTFNTSLFYNRCFPEKENRPMGISIVTANCNTTAPWNVRKAIMQNIKTVRRY